jgi:hypothetical protein
MSSPAVKRVKIIIPCFLDLSLFPYFDLVNNFVVK